MKRKVETIETAETAQRATDELMEEIKKEAPVRFSTKLIAREPGAYSIRVLRDRIIYSDYPNIKIVPKDVNEKIEITIKAVAAPTADKMIKQSPNIK